MTELKHSLVRGGMKSVLLLGDDGRMGQVLRGQFAGVDLREEPNILDGLLRVGRGEFDLVLLNVEGPRQKTAEAVRALKRVGGETQVVLYGSAWAEIYVREALKAGAADFLVWPIPAGDLRPYLQSGAPENRNAAGRRETLPPRLAGLEAGKEVLHQYQELAGLVPEGQERLIAAAEAVLPKILHAQWVKIIPGEKIGGAARPAEPDARRRYSLSGPQGAVGEMLLGPPAGKVEKGALHLAEESAAFLGTLLNLAWRDEHLKRLATVDELTGAYNRRYFEHFSRQVIEQGKNEKTEVTLLVFDIDEFKHYNDKYGHIAGDVILKEATRLMRRCCREHDVVARIGGDEFAVLFWDAVAARKELPAGACRRRRADQPAEPPPGERRRSHPEMVVFLSNRFRRFIRTNEFPILGSEARGVLTISGGLASFPWDGQTVEELLLKADDALLHAKRSGKNRIYLVGQPLTNNHCPIADL